MPFYSFMLNDGRRIIRDPEQQVELPDEASARAHACQVAREIMRNNWRTRSWRIRVCDDGENSYFEVLFASVDDAIAALPAQLQTSIEAIHRNTASLSDAIRDVQLTLYQVRATLARSERAPYLAALDGVQI